VGDAGVSIEVFADPGTRAEEMLAQGEEMFSWIPNAHNSDRVFEPCAHVFPSPAAHTSGTGGRKAVYFFSELGEVRLRGFGEG